MIWRNVLIVSSLLIIGSELQSAQFERNSGYWTTIADEARKDFFGTLTAFESQREDWYKVSPYIAEFWCALSNAGFIYAGIKHKSPELIFAGTASIISHAVPRQYLLYLDKLGVAIVAGKVLMNYNVVLQHPKLLIPLALAGGINAADAYLARTYGYTLPHVVWHLSAAYIAHLFLRELPR